MTLLRLIVVSLRDLKILTGATGDHVYQAPCRSAAYSKMSGRAQHIETVISNAQKRDHEQAQTL